MKFSKQKKAKMRKYRMARIKRAFMLRDWTDWDTGKVYEAIDKAY